MQLLPHFEPSGLDDQQHCMTSKPRKPVFSSFSLTALHFNRTITSHALVQLNLSFQPPHVSMQKGLVGDVRTNSFFFQNTQVWWKYNKNTECKKNDYVCTCRCLQSSWVIQGIIETVINWPRTTRFFMLGQLWVSFELLASCNSLHVIIVSSVIYSILPDSIRITNLTSSGKMQYTEALTLALYSKPSAHNYYVVLQV